MVSPGSGVPALLVLLQSILSKGRSRGWVSHELLVVCGWPGGPVELSLTSPSPSHLLLLGFGQHGEGVTASFPPLPASSSCLAEPCPWQAFRDSSRLKTLCPFSSRRI